MRKTIHKWFWIWDYEKEEEWLNLMSAKGLALAAVGFCRYEFEDCTPGEYQVRMVFLESRCSYPEHAKYIEFIEDTGAEHLGTFGRWAYFRRKTAEGDFQLFSDHASHIKYLTRIILFIALLGSMNLYFGCYNLFLYSRWNHPMSLFGVLNLLIALLCLGGLIRLLHRRRRLKCEQQIYE